MELHSNNEDGYVLAVCEGRMDESSSQSFRASIHPKFAERGVKVLVDLSGVPWINSEGISTMVRLVADANTHGCRVVFSSPGPFVREVLTVTRLERFFDIAANRTEALQMLDSQGS